MFEQLDNLPTRREFYIVAVVQTVVILGVMIVVWL